MGEYNYNNELINYEELKFLRANTVLSPIAILRINKLKEKIETFRKWYFKVEGELVDSDYTIADKLEYNLRFKIWQTKCASLWKQIPSDIGLYEYAKAAMQDGIIQNKKKIKNVSMR